MDNNKQLRTPLIKPRKQGGTFYTFASALEDIGLNINELGNKVTLSHYALLDIPPFDASTVGAVGDYSNNDHEGNWVFAEGFQNYVLNMETAVRNHPLYDFSNSITISERIFWKWLIKNHLMTVVPDVSNGIDTGYYVEDDPASSIVKCFGYINSGAQRSDDYSMYNETFVQVPSSFGQMKILFKVTEDDNYYATNNFSGHNGDWLEYLTEDDVDEDNYIKKTGIYADAAFDDDHEYTVDSSTDLLTIVFSLDALRSYYETYYDADETLTYDDLAIDSSKYGGYATDSFDFNAALIYYSVYDSTGKNILATNAYGLLIFDTADNRTTNNGFDFEPFRKKKATPTSSGTSYSFRLNIKTSSIYGGDIAVTDNSTPAYSMSTDFNDTIKNLNTAIGILRTNANHLAVIDTNYRTIRQLAVDVLEKEEELEKAVNDLKKGLFKKIDASVLHADQISIGNGIAFAEDASCGFSLLDGSICLSTRKAEVEDAIVSNLDTSVLCTNIITLPDQGTDFYHGEDIITHIGPEGVSSVGIYNIQDRTDNNIELDPGTIDDVLDNLAATFTAGHNFLINVNTDSTATQSGDILNALYDPNTKRLDLKGILAVILAKLKTLSN